MNAIYKLIWNLSTGTWAVAHELASARGKKTGRTRLASALAVALVLPAGAALADDTPDALTCAAGESLTADGLRCAPRSAMAPMSGGIGTQATTAELTAFVQFGAVYGGGGADASVTGAGAVAVGRAATAAAFGLAIGGNARATASQATGVGYQTDASGARSTALGNYAIASGNNGTALGSRTSATEAGAVAIGGGTTAAEGTTAAAINSIAIGSQAQAAAGADNGVAIGAGAQVSAANSVALGQGAVADSANSVSVGNTTAGGQRRIVNMAAGVNDTDAVNVGQMNTALSTKVDDTLVKVGGTGAATITGTSAGNIAIGNGASANSSGAFSATAIGNGASATGNGATAIGAGSNTNREFAFAVGSTTQRRQVVNVANGTDNNDAATVGQLRGVAAGLGGGAAVAADGSITAPSYTVGGTTVNNVGAALTNLDGRTTSNTTNIANIDGRVSTAEGNITSLQGSVTTVQGDLTNLGGRVTVNEGNITDINSRLDGLADGSMGIVSYDAASGTVNVAGAQGGSQVNFAGADGVRTLSGVKDGTIAAGSSEAVTGSQLNDTNERVTTNESNISSLDGRVTTNEGDITTLQGNVTNLDGRVTVNEGNITQLGNRVTVNEGNISDLATQVGELASGGAGIVTYDAASGTVNVAGAQGGSQVNFAGADGVRTLSGVKDGTIAAGSSEAVTGSQLNDTNERVTTAEGNITTVQGDVVNLGSRVTTNEGNISSLTTQVNNLASGGAGIVTYDAAGGVVNVASSQGGLRVNVAGIDGDRVLAGVADGKLEDGSNEAVNGSQLNETNERVSSAESNISKLDSRVTSNEGDINSLTTQVTNLASGAAGLVTIDATTGNVQVAADKGGDVVDMEGTDGKRRVSGVANGKEDGDAVTMAQLRAAGAIDPVSGDVLSVLTYDDSSLSKASLGGTNGTILANVAPGLIDRGSRDAVNGGQLWQMNADWEAKWQQMDGRVGNIERGIEDGSIGGPGNGGTPGNPGTSPGTGAGSVAIGDGADGSGKGSVAIGEGSKASGSGSVAIGEGASATGNNSVAVGAGSTADRDNEFSVGSQGNERVVSNVAAGVRPTDAVNVQQMDDRFKAEREYTDGRLNAMDKRLDRMGAISAAYAGMAINTAGLSGDNRVGAGIGSQNGRSALAVGYQRILGEKKNVSVSLGGAFSGSDQSVSAGAGFSW